MRKRAGQAPLGRRVREAVSIHVSNGQRRDAVPLAWLRRLARCAARRLRIRAQGQVTVTLIESRTMRALNRRFTRRGELTDVLSFRYPQEPIVGEILIAPAFARWYARRHGVSYRQELARYVIHGLLHWMGHDDRTVTQQRKMRAMEDQLLVQCTSEKV